MNPQLPTDEQVRAWVSHTMSKTTLGRIHKDLWPAIAMHAQDIARMEILEQTVDVKYGTATVGEILECGADMRSYGRCSLCKRVQHMYNIRTCVCEDLVCVKCKVGTACMHGFVPAVMTIKIDASEWEFESNRREKMAKATVESFRRK